MNTMNIRVRFDNSGYCLRCGRTQVVDGTNIDKCIDCKVMGFSID
ncbi:MAG: hypothetical protein VXY11_05095 [Candidatus Thermoplasmatota archaeon]|nr:hypothetical protein [Candidatus Thermoplasmatota archaeon]